MLLENNVGWLRLRWMNYGVAISYTSLQFPPLHFGAGPSHKFLRELLRFENERSDNLHE